jgi:hypothetical protein
VYLPLATLTDTLSFPHLFFTLFSCYLPPIIMSIPCEAGCTKWFRTIQGMNSHLTSARSCSWYLKGKLKDLRVEDDIQVSLNEDMQGEVEDDIDIPLNEDLQWQRGDDDEPNFYDPGPEPNVDFDYDLDDIYQPLQDFHFIPNDPVPLSEEQAQQGPGPSTAANRILQAAEQGYIPHSHRVLDEEEDETFVINHSSAGRILRTDPLDHSFQSNRDPNSDVEMGDDTNPFAPFLSELDWRVAQWAIKDSSGHKAFDRLLEIPGVSEIFTQGLVILIQH